MVTLQEIHTLLQRLDYPASKEDILEQLRRMGAPETALARLREIPEHYYGSVNTVMDALRDQE